MIDRNQVDLGANQNFVLQSDTAPVHEFATVVDEDVFPYSNILAEVGVERRQHPEGRVNGHAGEPGEKVSDLFRRPIASVDLRDQLLSFRDQGRDPAVLGIVDRNDFSRFFPLEDVHVIPFLSVRPRLYWSASAIRVQALDQCVANLVRQFAHDWRRERHPMAENFDHIPERRENWAEAEFKGKAKSVITLRSGHVLISDEPPGFAGGFGGANEGPTPTGFLAAAFAADIPAMLNRIARELGFEIVSLKARVQFAWNPRGIAGAEGIAPVPFEAVSDITLKATADAAAIDRMKAAYERRCPLHNLFKLAGCRMQDNWHVERA